MIMYVFLVNIITSFFLMQYGYIDVDYIRKVKSKLITSRYRL